MLAKDNERCVVDVVCFGKTNQLKVDHEGLTREWEEQCFSGRTLQVEMMFMDAITMCNDHSNHVDHIKAHMFVHPLKCMTANIIDTYSLVSFWRTLLLSWSTL